MPTIDMPLNELKAYSGINPHAGDFNEYWDKALAEMHAVDPQVELIPSKFQSPVADCYDLYFTGTHGARVYAKYLKPKVIKGKAPAVLMFHGYTINSGSWSDKVAYAASGFHVAALDCRGQGGLSEDVGGVKGTTVHGHVIRGLSDHPDKLLFRDIFLDTAQLASIVMNMPDVDENRVGAMGGSQGGGLTLACAALEPRISRLAPIYPFLCDYKRVWEMDLTKQAFAELGEYFRKFDPLHERENEIFTTLGYIDAAFLAKRIKGRVQFTTGLMDDVCPPSTQFAAYNNITAPKELVVYPDFGHEELPGANDRTYFFMMEMLEETTV